MNCDRSGFVPAQLQFRLKSGAQGSTTKPVGDVIDTCAGDEIDRIGPGYMGGRPTRWTPPSGFAIPPPACSSPGRPSEGQKSCTYAVRVSGTSKGTKTSSAGPNVGSLVGLNAPDPATLAVR